ncbi:hypothetical protein BV375_13555 [Nostoc sp. 106C]|nr:hypothetical protein BV375_13555 [Nostoc sp. 106C]
MWEKLRLLITYFQDIYFVLDITQSPFNVGLLNG